ncbi:tRNA epoxyqueuosine(34) reductase QueG [Balneatrix alpica]|uniref:tRNA epoxyqueuosine(34) reductase QueG n=1 Tax=Balneatrix alpica TaxID=75684 RepID=UPI00273A5A59|nr:tRNA epoxyqueuosine(34) reductase QueG [Balneatrix alpica]
MSTHLSPAQLEQLCLDIGHWCQELGFQQMGISGIELGEHPEYLKRWLAQGYHGEMDYLERHTELRAEPAQLHPGTLRVISVRMDYLAPEVETIKVLSQPERAYISRYALGRDYHKLIRKRLTELAKRIEAAIGPFGYRAFVDSAPVMERALANQAGLGWVGKNTMVMNRQAGSWFFLGELYTDLPLPLNTEQQKEHCGRCTSCLDLCPTKAFIAPYWLDARKCISYLTIEYKGSIPLELRPLIGNRIFGCDDCQLVCPWNRFARFSPEADFTPRHALDRATLLELFAWDEDTFLRLTEGSPIRRSGYECWQRNLAVALGNAPSNPAIIAAIEQRLPSATPLVAEHLQWALARQRAPQATL